MEGWTLPMILAVAGALLIIVALLDGGLVIKEIKIPPLSKPVRVISGMAGLLFIGVGVALWIISNQAPLPPPPNGPDHETNEPFLIYEDKNPDSSVHNMKFLELTARCVHKIPKVNDRVWIKFKMQNIGDEPVNMLGSYVTVYDPSGKNRDFAFSNKNKSIKPKEIIETSGNLIVDVPGAWEFGPHYALGTKWDGEQYPGHWKRFQLVVE